MRKKMLGLRFQTKILLGFIILIFVPITMILVTIVIKSEDEIKNSHINYLRQLNEQINNTMDIIIDDAERTSLIHISDSKMTEVLMKEYKQSPLEYAEDAKQMTEAAVHASRLNPYIFSVSFHGKNGNIYSSVGSTADYNIYNSNQKVDWMELLKNREKGRFVTNVYQGRYNPLITVAKQLLAMPSLEPIGYVWINLDFISIQGALNKKLESHKSNDFLIVQDGNILYNTNEEDYWMKEASDELFQKMNSIRKEPNGDIFTVKSDGKELLFVVSRNDTMNWAVVQYLPVSEIQRSFFQYIKFYALATALLLFVALLSGGILSLRMLRPINLLADGMKKIANGHLDIIDIEELRRDEMALLIKTFNRMVIRLKDSIQKEYISQMHERKVELKMLQAQINPHFLYNTLNLISSIADLEGVDKISTISNSLSDMFRYNIKGKDIVTLRDEIDQIKNYLTIQELRFPNRFSVMYDIEPSMYECRILKFLLQPIVENAIYHGMEQMKSNGTICISAKQNEGLLHITIQDNGKGITLKELNKINETFGRNYEHNDITEHEGSVGLYNVHWRIQTFYGKDFGLSIASEIEKGTSVHFTLPGIGIEEGAA